MAYEGGCQCGRIRYRVEAPRDRSSVCFCRMCQKAGGAPMMAFVRFAAADVSWSDRPAVFASSDKAERGFCPHCGTPLTYRWLDGPWVSVTLNSLDAPDEVEPELVFAADTMPAWLARVGDLPEANEALAADTAGFINHQQPDGRGSGWPPPVIRA